MKYQDTSKVITLKMQPIYREGEVMGSKFERIVQLTQQPIFYNERNCTVMAFADITEHRKIAYMEVQTEEMKVR